MNKTIFNTAVAVTAAALFCVGCVEKDSGVDSNGRKNPDSGGLFDGIWLGHFGDSDVSFEISGENYIMKMDGLNYGKGNITHDASSFEIASTHSWNPNTDTWETYVEKTTGNYTLDRDNGILILSGISGRYSAMNGVWTLSTIPTPTKTTFTDSRDGTVYKKVKIGNQVWMAENLNYDIEGGKCYGEGGMSYIDIIDEKIVFSDSGRRLSADEVQANCEKYGRLYKWPTAMNGESSSSAVPSGVRGICPAGWHLPSDAEWNILLDYAGETAGIKLKSSTGWHSFEGVPAGTDDYGFSALPGGLGETYNSANYVEYANIGYYSLWWSATEEDAGVAWNRGTGYLHEVFFYDYYERRDKSKLFSIRCVED